MRVIRLDAGGARETAEQTWDKWRSSAFETGRVLAHMDELYMQVTGSGAMAREMERWPNGNAEEDITFMKEFTTKRLAFVDEYIKQLSE